MMRGLGKVSPMWRGVFWAKCLLATGNVAAGLCSVIAL